MNVSFREISPLIARNPFFLFKGLHWKIINLQFSPEPFCMENGQKSADSLYKQFGLRFVGPELFDTDGILERF